MAHHVIEFDEQCSACKGTGLYVGLAERNGAAVVCYRCKGTGRYHFTHEYDDFVGRQPRADVLHVVQANPGIVMGRGRSGEFALSDFGGIPYAQWAAGEPFGRGTEMRQFVCPAWWYQSVNHDLKPDWNDERQRCTFGMFSNCAHFAAKDKCWQRWDAEHPDPLPQGA